jgi:DNA invertase Pin-like site-specific DNA recombinase
MGKSRHSKDLLKRIRADQGPPKPYIRPKGMTAEDIRDMLREGYSRAAIARFYQCSRSTVWRVENPEKAAAKRAREAPTRHRPSTGDGDFLSGPLSWFGL